MDFHKLYKSINIGLSSYRDYYLFENHKCTNPKLYNFLILEYEDDGQASDKFQVFDTSTNLASEFPKWTSTNLVDINGLTEYEDIIVYNNTYLHLFLTLTLANEIEKFTLTSHNPTAEILFHFGKKLIATYEEATENEASYLSNKADLPIKEIYTKSISFRKMILKDFINQLGEQSSHLYELLLKYPTISNKNSQKENNDLSKNVSQQFKDKKYEELFYYLVANYAKERKPSQFSLIFSYMNRDLENEEIILSKNDYRKFVVGKFQIEYSKVVEPSTKLKKDKSILSELKKEFFKEQNKKEQ